MSMYTTAQLLAANEQKFKFDPLFLRLFFRESYPFTTEKVYLSQIPGLVNMALYVSPIVSGEVIRQETLNECTRAEQSASVVLWEIDLTEVGGERYFFCNEQNEKGEPVTWQGRQYQPYPIQGSGFELNGKGTSTRPTLTVSNLYGMVTGMAEDMQSLVGGTVVRRKVYARFLDAVNFVNGNSDADPEQEVISRWRIEQCSELSAVSASFVLSTPTETDGAVFPGRIMLANTCTWTYRGDECGYHGPAVADEYDQPTSDITKDKCSKCLSGCKFRNNVGNFGGFLSINKLSQ
ncbi:phage minor tail protein L [Escherichia coli]|nr:phage minor tail protein L [Escherichia coli]